MTETLKCSELKFLVFISGLVSDRESIISDKSVVGSERVAVNNRITDICP